MVMQPFSVPLHLPFRNQDNGIDFKI